MSWLQRSRRPSHDDAFPGAEEGPKIDPDSGEILSSPRDRAMRGPESRATAQNGTVQGERSIPSVNRERSMQSRVSGALALAAVLLLGAGFLFWYYNTQYAKTRANEEAARKAAAARAGGEMKVPPLGRIEPPRPLAQKLTAAPPQDPLPAPGPATAVPGGPVPKTAEQLMLERQLGTPVLRRTQTPQTLGAAVPRATTEAPLSPTGGPGLAQLTGALQPHEAPMALPSGQLGANLRATPTPAVAARRLPTQRMLLPKGAFIDCTLETAIDSTYEGMATCIGASDVYGADGKVVLLERGTKYVGEQRGTPHQGQGRAFIVWNEARTPAGVAVPLASPGTDALGRSGLPGFVDTHFWDRFGAAIMISVIDGAMQAIAAQRQGGAAAGGGAGVVLGPQGSRDVMTEVLRRTISIPPTIIKNQGERIQILVARDVDFRGVYALRTDPPPP